MRRVLLICAALALFALPSAAAAGGHARTGWLVVRGASNDGGVNGSPVATVVVRGFVIGRIAGQGSVAIYQLGAGGAEQPQATGPDVAQQSSHWRGVPGRKWTGTGFRFRAVGGVLRVVVHGFGVYLFAGGGGNAILQGSSVSPSHDGSYALDGGSFHSLPAHPRKLRVGGA